MSASPAVCNDNQAFYHHSPAAPVRLYQSHSFPSGFHGSKAKHGGPPLYKNPLLHRLDEVLHDQGCFESEHGLIARREALKSLNILVSSWIHSTCLKRGTHWQVSHSNLIRCQRHYRIYFLFSFPLNYLKSFPILESNYFNRFLDTC